MDLELTQLTITVYTTFGCTMKNSRCITFFLRKPKSKLFPHTFPDLEKNLIPYSERKALSCTEGIYDPPAFSPAS